MLFTSLSAKKYICANIICLIYMPDRSVLKYTSRFTEWDCCQVLNLLSSILGNMASNVSLWIEFRRTHPCDNKYLEMVKTRGFQGLWQNVFIYNNCYVVV